MRPRALIVDSASEGTALGSEPESYLVLVFKDGLKLFQSLIPNPDYVAPPPRTALEVAADEYEAARAARAEAIEDENRAFWAWHRARYST